MRPSHAEQGERIVVESIVPNSNAARSTTDIAPGDQVLAVSARVLVRAVRDRPRWRRQIVLPRAALLPAGLSGSLSSRIQGEKQRRFDVLGTGRSKEGIFGELVIVPTQGQAFDTVMGAIGSNRCSQCDVGLVLARAR